MSLTHPNIAVLVTYFAGIAILGLMQAKKIHGTGDYFAGGRRFSKFFMMMHNFSASTHADDSVVVMGACSQMGLVHLHLPAPHSVFLADTGYIPQAAIPDDRRYDGGAFRAERQIGR
jgi:Na+/pantothenate symporter